MYVGDPTAEILLKCTSATAPKYAARFLFTSADYVHIGSKADTVDGSQTGMPGEYRHVAVYAQAMSPTEALFRYKAPLINALPVTPGGIISMVLQQNESITLQLNSTTYAYDFDGDQIVAIELATFPQAGAMYIDGVQVVGDNTSFDPLVSTLTYYVIQPQAYSMPLGASCNSTYEYASFSFRVSDATGQSLDTTTIRMCVENTPDTPYSPDVTISQVYVGQKRMFTIDLTDVDFDPRRDNYSEVERILFYQEQGTYGRLRRSLTGEECDGSYMTAGHWYPWVVYEGITQFRFCYETSTANASAYGVDIFVFKSRDLTGLESPNATITATLVAPLQICPTEFIPHPIAELDGADEVCASASDEYPEYVPVYLQAADLFTYYGELDPPRSVAFYVTVFPTYGTLYLASGANASATAVTVNTTAIPDVPAGATYPPLWYRGPSGFFTRIGALTYVNGIGLGIDGCAHTIADVDGTSCRCAVSEEPGCAEIIEYYAKATHPSTGDVEQSDATLPYSIHVLSTFSEMRSVVVPTSGISITTSTAVTHTPFVIAFDDLDDDAYMIGVNIYVYLRQLDLTIDLPAADLVTNSNWTFTSECGTVSDITEGCTTITAYAYPTRMQYLLSKLVVITRSKTISQVHSRIYVQLYKPSPAGMTAELAAGMGVVATDFTYDIPVTVRSASTTSLAGFDYLSIILSALFFTALSCCTCWTACTLYSCCKLRDTIGELCCCCCSHCPRIGQTFNCIVDLIELPFIRVTNYVTKNHPTVMKVLYYVTCWCVVERCCYRKAQIKPTGVVREGTQSVEFQGKRFYITLGADSLGKAPVSESDMKKGE